MPNLAEDYYVGSRGREYAAAVLVTDDRCQRAMALTRARKLQRYIAPQDTVLEIGVGVGTNLWHLNCQRRAGYDVGDFGRGDCESHGVSFYDDLSQLGDERFSVVLLHHALEHVPNPLETIKTAQRYLTPSGKLLIFVPLERCTRYLPDQKDHHLFSWTPQTLGNLAALAGVENVSVTTGPFGYERFLAPLSRFGMSAYWLGLRAAQTIRPVREVILIGNRGQ